jgi:hypothetical protein
MQKFYQEANILLEKEKKEIFTLEKAKLGFENKKKK